MELKFRKLREDAVEPINSDSGISLANIGFTQEFDRSGKMILAYHTGLSVEIPEGYVGLIFSEPSISQRSLALTDGVGILSSGNDGEIVVKFKITTDALPTIYNKEELIARMIVIPIEQVKVSIEKLSIETVETNDGNKSESEQSEGRAAEGDDKQLQA